MDTLPGIELENSRIPAEEQTSSPPPIQKAGLSASLENKPMPQNVENKVDTNQHSTTPAIPKQNATPERAPKNDIEEANDEIANLLLSNRITVHESSKLQSVLRENGILKDKITKLKTLLARSAKASKETKQDLEQHKRLLDVAKKEVERLNDRVEALASRPTHMDLLADFETNFDRALMNLHTDDMNMADRHASASNLMRQSVGQATVQSAEEENVSSMLMAELNQAKARVEQMESVNHALKQRSAQFEKQNDALIQERESLNLKMSNLQLENRMAKMETENATRAMKEKTASLAEMQMEIDLVTRSALDANARAAEGMEVAENAKTDKAQVEELKAKVSALQEWAVASAAAKEAIVEENKMLEKKLREYETDDEETVTKREATSPNGNSTRAERHLWTKTSSLVIGAGAVQFREIELGNNQVMDFETVILRWKFDITPSDTDIHFSILKGKADLKKRREDVDAVIRDRVVLGGGGGEVQGAFAVQNTCSLIFSNEHSWVRPRAVKYTVEAVAVM